MIDENTRLVTFGPIKPQLFHSRHISILQGQSSLTYSIFVSETFSAYSGENEKNHIEAWSRPSFEPQRAVLSEHRGVTEVGDVAVDANGGFYSRIQ